MRFYVAGPYTAEHPRQVLKNVNNAIDVGMELMRKGHHVLVPHLTHYMHLRPHCDFEYQEYIKNDLAWLEVADALFFIGHSKGADIELNLAKERGITIFYKLDEVPNEKNTDLCKV